MTTAAVITTTTAAATATTESNILKAALSKKWEGRFFHAFLVDKGGLFG